VQALPPWVAENQLHSVQRLPSRQAEIQLRDVHPMFPQQVKKYKTARADPPRSKRIKRDTESSPEIKQEPEIKQAPEPFTIQGYFGFDK
jgi:hypothetical protein